MTDTELKESMQEGLEVLDHWSRMIAALPLEEWKAALDRAETLAPILDPTLYRDYLYSPKPKIIKEILDAAIPLKRTILRLQIEIIGAMAKEQNKP